MDAQDHARTLEFDLAQAKHSVWMFNRLLSMKASIAGKQSFERERESEDLERAELHSYETVRILFLFHKVLPLDKNYLTACAKYIKCTV